MGYKFSWSVSSLKCLDVDDQLIHLENYFLSTLGRIEKHRWPDNFIWKLPYPQTRVKFIQQSGDKLHNFCTVIYIDRPVWRYEHTKLITISGWQIHKVYEFTPSSL